MNPLSQKTSLRLFKIFGPHLIQRSSLQAIVDPAQVSSPADAIMTIRGYCTDFDNGLLEYQLPE